jgi:hypothetical protein
LRVDDATVRQVISELVDLHLIEPASSDVPWIRFSDEGQAMYRRLRGAVEETIAMLYTDIPDEELATAGRVLILITERANAELARVA